MQNAIIQVAKYDRALSPRILRHNAKKTRTERKKKTALSAFIQIKYVETVFANGWQSERRKNHVKDEKPSTWGDRGVSSIMPVSANVRENAAVIAPSSHPFFNPNSPNTRENAGAKRTVIQKMRLAAN
jgi:hypothetical protein